MSEHQPLPVKGYKPQSDADIALANELKEAEERYLRLLDRMMATHEDVDGEIGQIRCPRFDPRFMALARTHMQTANMFAVRAIFQPARIKLPEDA